MIPWSKVALWTATLLLVGPCTAAPSADAPCTLHHAGKYYDLNPLKVRKDYELKLSGGHDFYLNVCASVTHEVWGLKEDPVDVAGVIRRDHGDFSVGKMNTTVIPTDAGLALQFTKGSKCGAKNDGSEQAPRASTLIEFLCDRSVYGVGKPRLVAQLPPDDDNAACAFTLEWRTHFACPTGEGGGIWGFFVSLVVLIVALLMLYIVLGTVYNRYVLHMRGFDQIPQFSLESLKYHSREALDLLRDCMGQLYEGGQRMFSGGLSASGGFNIAVGRNDNNFGRPTTNPVSHQTQVDVGNNRPQSDKTGFVRPTRRAETNPVSHQSQVHAQQQQRTQPPPTQSQQPQTKLPTSITKGSTAEERQFMLGDDEDDGDDGQESDIVKAAPQDSSKTQAVLIGPSAEHGEDTGDSPIRL